MTHHYDELYPGRFLKATTLTAPRTIRILSLGGELLPGDDGEKSKGILKYRDELGVGEIVWCKTNAALTARALGTDDYTQWANRLITIANDPSVMFGGERVGGIRVCGSPELKAEKRVEIKRPRRKKPDTFLLYPTDGKGNRKGAATKPAPQTDPTTGEREPGQDETP